MTLSPRSSSRPSAMIPSSTRLSRTRLTFPRILSSSPWASQPLLAKFSARWLPPETSSTAGPSSLPRERITNPPSWPSFHTSTPPLNAPPISPFVPRSLVSMVSQSSIIGLIAAHKNNLGPGVNTSITGELPSVSLSLASSYPPVLCCTRRLAHQLGGEQAPRGVDLQLSQHG